MAVSRVIDGCVAYVDIFDAAGLIDLDGLENATPSKYDVSAALIDIKSSES